MQPIEQQSVRDAHQYAFHVVLQFRDELYTIDEKPFKEIFADVSLVRDELPVDELHESLVFERLPVVHVPKSYLEVEQLTPLIADKVQLKAEEPAHEVVTVPKYAYLYVNDVLGSTGI